MVPYTNSPPPTPTSGEASGGRPPSQSGHFVQELFSVDVIPLLLVNAIPLLKGIMWTLPRLILYVFPAVNFKNNMKSTSGGRLGKVRVNVRG